MGIRLEAHQQKFKSIAGDLYEEVTAPWAKLLSYTEAPGEKVAIVKTLIRSNSEILDDPIAICALMAALWDSISKKD